MRGLWQHSRSVLQDRSSTCRKCCWASTGEWLGLTGLACWNASLIPFSCFLGEEKRDQRSLTWGLLAEQAVEEVHGGVRWAAGGLGGGAPPAEGAQGGDPTLGPPVRPAAGHARESGRWAQWGCLDTQCHCITACTACSSSKGQDVGKNHCWDDIDEARKASHWATCGCRGRHWPVRPDRCARLQGARCSGMIATILPETAGA